MTVKTKTEARQKLNALTRSRDNGEQVGDGNTTVAQLVDKWMARDVASRSIAPSTLDTYRWSTRTINADSGADGAHPRSVAHVLDCVRE